MQHICHSADREILRRTEHFRAQPETEKGVLYIYADKKGVLLFCSKKKQKTSRVLMRALKSGSEDLSSLWISYDDLGVDPKRNAHLIDEVTEFISQVWDQFTQIQNEILEELIAQSSAEEIMSRMIPLIRKPFVVVDRNMLLIYAHPDIPGLMTEALGEGYFDEIVEELLIAKEFHEVAKKREPFYYKMDIFEQGGYCINVMVDDYYYARIVTYVDKGEEKLVSGAEQITEYMAGVIAQMIRSGVLKLHRGGNDRLHMICQSVLENGTCEKEQMRPALRAYGWGIEDSLQAFYLEPHRATGWETQIENTMPTITRKLEQIQPGSIAVFSGKEIMWLVNKSRSVRPGDAADIIQKLPEFLRENLFRAGCSSVFKDITLLESALKEAGRALELGSQKDPSYWYYRFDDYRMEYMIKALKEQEIDGAILAHPAVDILNEHDRINESELGKTLMVFLEKRLNVTQAAQALFIHRTTLFRRLNQVKELTGLDLDDADTVLELQLSYRMQAE